jgi:hypothetical protein
MNVAERASQIARVLDAIRSGWPLLVEEIDDRISALTEQLINNDNEQTRGAIKELRRLRDMPDSLNQEREGIQAALADQAAAD